MKPANAFDIHAHITDQIVAAIETGADDWQMPWRRAQGALHRPANALTGKAYQGVNILSLWVTAEHHGYATPRWASYKQWQEKGAQVRKGERGTPIVFYKELEKAAEEGGDSDDPQRVLFARASWVFNAAQVDGYAVPLADDAPLEDRIAPIEAAEALIAAAGAVVRESGDRAFYQWGEDYIGMPDRGRFIGTQSSTPTDAWYATHLHELTHWTGAKHRLDRQLANRFGSAAYAMEELIAELGSAFLCADIGLTTAPRPDHAAYVAHWLKVLKEDKRAIFTAASQADKAARYLTALAPVPHRPDPPDPERQAPLPR